MSRANGTQIEQATFHYYRWLNYYLTSMLAKLIRRGIFVKCYSLKNPTYALPEEINWLQNKFSSEPSYADRFTHLQNLEKMNMLPSFYEDKPLNALSEADIFFLMNSNTNYNLNRRGQMQLIVKVQSTYFKCLLYKQFGLTGEVEQQIIIPSFNQQVGEMQPYQLAFCLGVIHGFDKYKQLDLHRLEKALERYTSHQQYKYEMLIIHGYLAEMGLALKKLLTVKLFEGCVQGNTNWDLKAIYFVFLLSEVLKIEVDSSLKAKLDQHLKKAITKYKFNQFETNYLVFLLKYYPQQAHKINIAHFTPKAYLGYLNYFKLNAQLTLKEHKIPNSVLELSSFDAFKEIIELRLHLKLDTLNSIARSIPDYFVYSLNPVSIFLSYLRENKINDVEIEYFLQKAIKSKLHLQQFDPQKLEEYSVEETISLLTKLSKMHLCPVDFWRSTVRWIESLLLYNKTKAVVIEPNNTNYINLLHLVVTKNFKEETREIIYGKITELLERIDHPWQLQQLYRLTKTLSLSKIGEQKVWLLIEHRVFRFIQKKASGQIPEGIQQNICRIAQQFGFIGQGSYNFWTTINEKLSNKAKKEILDRIKSPSSQAHLYLKIFPES